MNNTCKILVLSDVDKSTRGVLKNGINLAKMLNGEIDFFCVKKPTDIVEKESQLSAMRSINENFIKADNTIKKLIKDLSANEKIPIRHKISFGNLKDEISDHLKDIKPDIVVLGKRKSTILSFMGDNIIDFVLKEYAGTTMIVSEKNPLEATTKISLGLLNDANSLKNRFAEKLVSYTNKPLKSFQINTKSSIENKTSTAEKTIDFIFEEGDHVFKNMGNYLSKNNINLLFVNRENEKIKSSKSRISNLANNLDCSLMLTN
ncbi:universal stress protein [uncultured Polaribacter sp.]|uniref:universal stress protein n=1 Tax=uncultured Polaribacter sp. TaxID=174711 RepID=UPI002616893B|nr:universal stress protein [uncultured Polaribacter sp.]